MAGEDDKKMREEVLMDMSVDGDGIFHYEDGRPVNDEVNRHVGYIIQTIQNHMDIPDIDKLRLIKNLHQLDYKLNPDRY